MKITEEHSKKIEALVTSKTFTLQDIISLLDNLYTDNQIKYHINKHYPELKGNLVKEYSKGGTKLEYILKELFPYDKIHKEFPLGEKLRVDFVIGEPYNLAFEFDGVQHHEYSSFFHGSKGAFQEANQRDQRKEFLLHNRGIHLIRLSSLEMDQTSLQLLIESVGYGNGIVLDKSLLTFAEKRDQNTLELRRLRKEHQSQSLKKNKAKEQQSEKNKAYKDSLKEQQKEYRKEQYEKQKQWLKQNKKR